jgi:Ca2+-binding RTX toxin-like protein
VCLCPDEVQDERGVVIDLQIGIARRHSYQVVLESIERAQGTVGPDTLIGSAKPNQLDGGAGDDHLDGGEGVDILDGSSGEDTCLNGETVKDCEVLPVPNSTPTLADN